MNDHMSDGTNSGKDALEQPLDLTDDQITQIEDVEQKLGVEFHDKAKALLALTHSSSMGPENYERLEFLGDRVLGLAMADLLYEVFPKEAEGGLAKRHAALVQGTTLAEIAQRINLNDNLILSDAERQSGGALNENILADCVESLLGAVYLDQGFEPCKNVIEKLWGERIQTFKRPPQDPKTELQEWVQSRGLPLPKYDIIGRKGPDHAPIFTIEVAVEGFGAVSASGPSRRLAEKGAAQIMLQQIVSAKS